MDSKEGPSIDSKTDGSRTGYFPISKIPSIKPLADLMERGDDS